MIQQQTKREAKPGDYVISRGADTPSERTDCKLLLRQNGCRSVRFEVRSVQYGDGPRTAVLFAHGYMAALEGFDVEST